MKLIWIAAFLCCTANAVANEPVVFTPGHVSTTANEVRITFSPDGHDFSRERSRGEALETPLDALYWHL